MRRTCLSIALATGCAYISDEDESWRLDPDGDGVPIGQDCDDASASLGAAVSFYADSDGDGYGDPAVAEEACTRPEGFVANADDCDDTSAGAFPGNAEVWYDGVDGDCAGDDDFDQDGDGYSIETDCDDTDPERFPDPEVDEIYFNGEDDNCDASDGDGDQDGDGFWAADYVNRCNGNSVIPLEIPAGKEGDCWDDPSVTPEAYETRDGFEDLDAHEVNPDALETWYDGADQDCDGASDFDRDGDGYDSEAELAGGTDCDDGSAGETQARRRSKATGSTTMQRRCQRKRHRGRGAGVDRGWDPVRDRDRPAHRVRSRGSRRRQRRWAKRRSDRCAVREHPREPGGRSLPQHGARHGSRRGHHRAVHRGRPDRRVLWCCRGRCR